MPQPLNNLLSKIAPFIGMAIFAVIFIVGLVFFSYLLIVAAILALILFAIGYIRMLILRHRIKKHFQQHQQFHKKQPEDKGRIIEHDEIK